MPNSLKNIASKVFGSKDEIDVILDMEITKLRLELKEAYQNKFFEDKHFRSFVERLSKIDNISAQVEYALKASEAGKVENLLDIQLNTETKQLLWAATLTRMMQTGEGPITKSKLWEQIQNSIGLYNEGISIANVISTSMRNDEVTFDWGQPGSWFYFNPATNHMNFDLYFMLTMGFDHIRQVQLHEIGHADLSVGYPPSMQKLFEEVQASVNPITTNKFDEDGFKEQKPAPKKAQKTKKEQVDLAVKIQEWTMRQRAWNFMEDITVNQFSCDMSYRLPQDFGYSMNHIGTDLVGWGDVILGNDLKKPVKIFTDKSPEQKKAINDHYNDLIKRMITPLTPQEIADIKAGNISVPIANKMFNQIQNMTLLSGYSKNNLFASTKENWERFHIFRQDINAVVDLTNVADAKGRDAFRYLAEICAGNDKSIRLSLPKLEDRFLIRDGHTSVTTSYREVVKDMNTQRNLIMETIWDVYMKPFADVLIQGYAKKLEERLDKKQEQKQGSQSKDQSQKGSSGQDGDPQQGQGGGDPSNDQGDGEPMDMDEQLENDAGEMSETPQEGRKKQSGQEGPDQGGENEPGDDNDGAGEEGQDKEGQGEEQKQDKAGAGGEEGDEKKDAKDKANGGDKANDNKDEAKDKGEKAGGPGWGKEPDDGKPKNPKRVSDVKNKSKVDDGEKSQADKQAMKDQAQDMPAPDPDSLSSGAGSGDGVDLAKLAKGNWSDFNRRMIELAPVINRLTDSYKRIRDEQKRQVLKESRSLDFMAEDGDVMARLDPDKMMQTKFRQATGQKITPDDFKKFKEDESHSIYSTIEMFYMIDGSGSMPMVKLPNGVTAMEAALQSAAIGYMACRKAGIDSYIMIWGNSSPQVVATPKSDLKEVGRKLEALRNGINSGTDLAPAVIKAIESMSVHKNNNGTISGSSHILVYSDGDIGDKAASAQVLDIVAKNAKNMSIDVAVLKVKKEKTEMENVIQAIVDKTGDRIVGLVNGNDPQQIPLELSRLMLKRVKSFKIKAEPDTKKRQRLKQLYGKIKK